MSESIDNYVPGNMLDSGINDYQQPQNDLMNKELNNIHPLFTQNEVDEY